MQYCNKISEVKGNCNASVMYTCLDINNANAVRHEKKAYHNIFITKHKTQNPKIKKKQRLGM